MATRSSLRLLPADWAPCHPSGRRPQVCCYELLLSEQRGLSVHCQQASEGAAGAGGDQGRGVREQPGGGARLGVRRGGPTPRSVCRCWTMPGCNSYRGAPTQRGCIGHPGGGDIALEDRGYALFVRAGTSEEEGRPMKVAALEGHRAPDIGTFGDAMSNGMMAIGFHWHWRTDGKQRTGGRSISNICTGLRVRRAHRPGQLLMMGVGQRLTQSLRPCSRRPQARQIGNRGGEELRDLARL